MFCADSSSWIPYLAGESGSDVKLLETWLQQQSLGAGITRSELLKLIPLHARDTDFRPFSKYTGLELVLHGLVN